MTDEVKIGCENGVLEILFDRPAKKNALSEAMYAAFADALARADADDTIRAVLIRGAGDAFCAGNDLSEFAKARTTSIGLGERNVGRVLYALAAAKKPLVAAVQGLAVGIGTTMLLHCDLVYVTPEARLTAPFVNLAIVPEAASTLLLPARIGHVRAFEMFALGRAMTGEEAVAMGLANRLVAAADLDGTARAAATALAARAPASLLVTKRLMREVERIEKLIAVEAEEFDRQVVSDEAQEVFAAFAEKRPPDFSKLV